jgi:hypothetical protein
MLSIEDWGYLKGCSNPSGVYAAFFNKIWGPPVFYAEHRRSMPTPVLYTAEPRNTPLDRGRHANLALLSLVGSMAYGFAINQSSMQSIEDQP